MNSTNNVGHTKTCEQPTVYVDRTNVTKSIRYANDQVVGSLPLCNRFKGLLDLHDTGTEVLHTNHLQSDDDY